MERGWVEDDVFEDAGELIDVYPAFSVAIVSIPTSTFQSYSRLQ